MILDAADSRWEVNDKECVYCIYAGEKLIHIFTFKLIEFLQNLNDQIFPSTPLQT